MPFWLPLVVVPAIVDSIVVLIVALKIVPDKIARATQDLQDQVNTASTEIAAGVIAGANAMREAAEKMAGTTEIDQ